MAMLLCGGCSDNAPEPTPQPATATFTITTRAAGDNNTTDKELINSWWMLFVDNSSNKICRILERPSDKTGAVESEEFIVSLTPGRYTIYAFANISKDGIKSLSDVNEGQLMPDLSAEIWEKEVGSIGDFVPMTGKHEVDLTSGEVKQFNVEVVRLWAKLCFQFTTDAAQSVTISKISMVSALTGAVRLLPDYASLEHAPVLPDNTVCSLLERETDLLITNTEGKSETFYLFESTAQGHPTGHYPLSFELKYGDGKPRTVSALAYQLEHINRNDFITIPVLITDWLVDIDVRFYPPIGGYPAVFAEKKDDEFYVKFGTSGYFELLPKVTNANTGAVLASDKYIVTQLSVESGNALFFLEPTLKDGEIVGELAEGKTGTAVVHLEITVTEGALQHTFIRKLHIIK